MNANGRSWLRKVARALQLGGDGDGAHLALPMPHDEYLWAVNPAASWQPTVALHGRQEPGGDALYVQDGVAVIDVVGHLSKHPSIWRVFGCSNAPTLSELAQLVREAAADPQVDSILLNVDSPGGTLFGTIEVADAVWDARQQKTVVATVTDQGCSGAYYIASQASEVVTNRVGEVGCLGIFSVRVDASRAAEAEGIRFHVISTGDFKGAGYPYSAATEEELAYLQSVIDAHHENFLALVARGRGMSVDQVRELSDGRIHVGEASVGLGLADGVATFQELLEELSGRRPRVARGGPSEPEEDQGDDGGEMESTSAAGVPLAGTPGSPGQTNDEEADMPKDEKAVRKPADEEVPKGTEAAPPGENPEGTETKEAVAKANADLRAGLEELAAGQRELNRRRAEFEVDQVLSRLDLLPSVRRAGAREVLVDLKLQSLESPRTVEVGGEEKEVFDAVVAMLNAQAAAESLVKGPSANTDGPATPGWKEQLFARHGITQEELAAAKVRRGLPN